MALYTYKTQKEMEKMLNSPKYNPNSQVVYDTLTGNNAAPNDNFFTKRAKSVENALGTTGAAIVSAIDTANENRAIEQRLQDYKTSMNNIAKKYGYNTYNDVWDARDAAEASGDNATLDRIDNIITPELQAQAKANADNANQAAKNWQNYRENSYVGQKVNQDQGKFLGSAINTLSTATDVLGLTNGPISNAIQGGIEGIADELEQNGLQNFDWGRAGQNALTGAATGAVTGLVNKGISNNLAKKGGNLFKGGNKLTQGINNLGSKTAVGRGISTLATGAGRGAISGAVGGATGAGLQSALNGVDFGQGIANTFQGATQGAAQGALAGAAMAGANMAINKTPFMQKVNQAQEDWKNSGDNFNERLTNTLNSGDSRLGNWINGQTQSKLLGSLGNGGMSVQDIGQLTDNRGRIVPTELAQEYSNIDPRLLDENGNLKVMYHGTPNGGFEKFNDGSYFTEDKNYADVYQNPSASSLTPKTDASNPMTYETYINAKKLFSLDNPEAKDIYINDYIKGGNALGINPYQNDYSDIKNIDWTEVENLRDFLNKNRQYGYDGIIANEGGVPNNEGGVTYRPDSIIPLSGEQVSIVRNNTPVTNADNQSNTPTTLGGWLKKAGQRVVEDVNNRGVGMSIKDAGGEDRIPLDESMRRINSVRAGETDAETIGKLPSEYMESDNYSSDINYVDRILKHINERGANHVMTPQELAYSTNNYSNSKILEFMSDNGKTHLDIVKPIADNNSIVIGLEKQPDGNLLVTNFKQKTDDNYLKNLQKKKNATILYDTTSSAFPAATDEPASLGVMDRSTGSNIPQNKQNVNDLTSVFEPDANKTIQSRNKLQSVGQQLQTAAKTQKYGALYDSLDAKTAARAVKTGAPETLTKLGVRPENYLEAAKTSDYVNKVVSDLAEQSNVKVNVPDLVDRLSLDNVDVIMSEPAAKKYNSYIKQIIPDGSNPDEYSAGYLLQKSRELGNKAANLRGNTDDVNTLRTALTDAKYTLRDLAASALESSELTGDLTNDNIAKGLAKMGANEAIQDYYTEAVDGKAPSITDYIRRSSLFEQARDMGTQIEAEKYTRSASKAPTNPFTRVWNATGLDQPVNTLLKSTVAPIAGGLTNVAGKVVEGAGNLAAKVGGSTPSSTAATPSVSDTAYNPATQIYNAIGRTEGEIQGEKAAANYLTEAANNTEPVAIDNNGQGTASTAVYDAFTGTTASSPASSSTGQTTMTSGDYYTDLLGRAMQMALDDNNAAAYVALLQMYQEAASEQSSASTEQVKLTDKQRQANAAALALDELKQLTPDTAYNLSDIPVIGKVATLGGNSYETAAKSLAQQVGYMLSGANVTKDEAENIGKAYVPLPRDNETIRQQKLNKIRGIISEYQRTYSE